MATVPGCHRWSCHSFRPAECHFLGSAYEGQHTLAVSAGFNDGAIVGSASDKLLAWQVKVASATDVCQIADLSAAGVDGGPGRGASSAVAKFVQVKTVGVVTGSIEC